jgi:hypothetical protein
VRAQLDAPCEGTRIFALDLAGDTWRDFEYFLRLDRLFESEGDLINRNRHLRAAISALFSHFDGIVGDLFNVIRRCNSEFGNAAALKDRRWSVNRKVSAITAWVAKKTGIVLPAVSDELKLLRDILNHPSITKESTAGGPTETLVYDAADVDGLDIQDVDASANQLSGWLDAACRACEMSDSVTRQN